MKLWSMSMIGAAALLASPLCNAQQYSSPIIRVLPQHEQAVDDDADLQRNDPNVQRVEKLRKPIVCKAPRSKFYVIYEHYPLSTSRDAPRPSMQRYGSYICIERERATTERGIGEIQMHLLRQSGSGGVLVVSLLPLSE